MDLDATASSFDWHPHLLSQSGGRARRASFTDGREAALAFMWEPAGVSNPRVYLIKTQAPFVIEQLQRVFGTGIDGKFGDLTRKAVINGLRAGGYNYPDNAPVSVPFMADALAYGLFGGGRVAFPAAVDLPNISSPRRATNPTGRDSTLFSAIDVATGQAVPLVANGPHVVPATANQPASTTAPTPGATTTNNYTNTTNTTNNYGQQPGAQPGQQAYDPQNPPPVGPGVSLDPSQVVPGMFPPGVYPDPSQSQPGMYSQPQVMPVLTMQQQQFLASLPPQQLQQVQLLAQQYGPWVFQSVFSANVNGGAQIALGCDKGTVDDKGVCVGGYAWVNGRLLIPSPPGLPAVDYADPKTYGKRVLDKATENPGKALAPIIGTGLAAFLAKLAAGFYGI